MDNRHSHRAGESFLVRWRGRVEGPLSVEEIEGRLENGQLGMLSQIKLGDDWVSLRRFFQGVGETKAVVKNPLILSRPSQAERPPAPSSDDGLLTARPARVPLRERILTAHGMAFACLAMVAGGLFAAIHFSNNARETQVPVKHAPAASASPRVSTTNAAPSGSNQVTQSSAGTNAPNADATASKTEVNGGSPALPPLPANESRTFRLKDLTEQVGTILNADEKGIIIRSDTGKLSARIPWISFDMEALAREPKVIAYHRDRVAAAEAAERAKAVAEEHARRRAEFIARQEELIDQAIQSMGWKEVRNGYLNGWGAEVTIGRIFDVVSSNTAQWSAVRLASSDLQRYTHYRVEAVWRNQYKQRVAVRFLVPANGSGFILNGCFLDGSRMADGPFINSIKVIWNEKNQ